MTIAIQLERKLNGLVTVCSSTAAGLFAKRPATQLDMQVIPMRGVVGRAEHRAEALAGAGVDGSKELANLGAFVVPGLIWIYVWWASLT